MTFTVIFLTIPKISASQKRSMGSELKPMDEFVADFGSFADITSDWYGADLLIGNLPELPRSLCAGAKKSKWSCDEDRDLAEAVKRHGTGNWCLVAQHIPGRTRKQCRERWLGHLSPSLSKGSWTADEDRILLEQQRIFGNSWSQIEQAIPGRSAIAVKNRWVCLAQLQRRQMAAPLLPFAPKTSTPSVCDSSEPIEQHEEEVDWF
jgi:hypothetical protein